MSEPILKDSQKQLSKHIAKSLFDSVGRDIGSLGIAVIQPVVALEKSLRLEEKSSNSNIIKYNKVNRSKTIPRRRV